MYAHVRSEERGEQLRAALEGAPLDVLVADLAAADGPGVLVQQAAALSEPLKCVVNNAGGVMSEMPFQSGQVNDPELIYRVNVFAAYEVSVRAAELMDEGSIVNICSVNAHSPLAGARIPLYSSSKAALSHLTRMLAIKLSPSVRVNAVSPGRTRTEAWGQPEPEQERAIVADQLIGRWIEPDEIADAAWFLHSNGACTGADLLVDGGMDLTAIATMT